MNISNRIKIALLITIIAVAAIAIYIYSITIPEGKEKILIWGSTENPEACGDPHAHRGYTAYILQTHVFEALYRFKTNSSELEPCLATGYQYVTPTIVEYTLRHDVKFHDGTPFNASCVKYSFDRFISKKTGDWTIFEPMLESVEVVDDYTVRFNLKQSYGGFPYMNLLASSCIISPSAVEKYGDDFATYAVGTGPIIMEGGWIPGEGATFVPNEEYWNEERIPKWDKLIYRVYKDTGTLKMALETGEIDIAFRSIAASDVPSLLQNPDIQSFKRGDSYAYFLGMNLEMKYTNNTLIRKAIAYCIPYDDIIALVDGVRIYSVFDTELLPQLKVDAQEIFIHNLTKARELLADAGYPEGLPETLKLHITDHYGAGMVGGLTLVQAELKKVGINVDLVSHDYPELLSLANNAALQISIFRHGSTCLDPDYSAFYSYYEEGANCRRFSAKSEEASALVLQARSETDPEQRWAIYNKLQEDFDPMPFQSIYLCRMNNYLFARKWVKNAYLGPIKTTYPIDLTVFDINVDEKAEALG